MGSGNSGKRNNEDTRYQHADRREYLRKLFAFATKCLRKVPRARLTWVAMETKHGLEVRFLQSQGLKSPNIFALTHAWTVPADRSNFQRHLHEHLPTDNVKGCELEEGLRIWADAGHRPPDVIHIDSCNNRSAKLIKTVVAIRPFLAQEGVLAVNYLAGREHVIQTLLWTRLLKGFHILDIEPGRYMSGRQKMEHVFLHYKRRATEGGKTQ